MLATLARSGIRTGVSSTNLAVGLGANYAKRSGLISEDTAKKIKEGSSSATTYVNSSINKKNQDKLVAAGKEGITFVKSAYNDPAAAAGIAANKAKAVGSAAVSYGVSKVNAAVAPTTLAQRQRQSKKMRQRQRQSKKMRQRQRQSKKMRQRQSRKH